MMSPPDGIGIFVQGFLFMLSFACNIKLNSTSPIVGRPVVG